MVLLWFVLGLVICLLAWAAWRQKRYGGTTTYDRNAYVSDWHRSDHHPWGLGNQAGKEDPGSHQ